MTLKIGMKWDGEFPLVDLKDAIADNADLRGDRYRNDAALWTTAGPTRAELGPSSEISLSPYAHPDPLPLGRTVQSTLKFGCGRALATERWVFDQVNNSSCHTIWSSRLLL